MHTFPFGSPIQPVQQRDCTPKRVFVLGVYSSAVHARWIGPDGKLLITAMAVANEPEIFWRGDGADEIIARIPVPAVAGHLVAATGGLNGPSGVALDGCFLSPLGVSRADTWLCDLLPESRMNSSQQEALAREYLPRQAEWGLPAFDFPPVPATLADAKRRDAIATEIAASQCELLVTLGDEPLRWFTSHFGSHAKLSAYGEDASLYGRRHPITVSGRQLELLPLVHPRQAAALGSHSPKWAALHHQWMSARLPQATTAKTS